MKDNPVIELAHDTLRMNKQALVFVNSKASAEKTAEDIAHGLKKTMQLQHELPDACLSALDHPTKQCERLAKCLEYSIAFHHAGLPAKQRVLVEEEFRKGNVKIICCTPTLAAGINLPSFRAIIKDLKRYGVNGMAWIPNLEYQQMAGRCGRPDFNDTHGEAIVIATDDKMKDELYKRYVTGKPESIYSKLAVEPVFRMYVLSLIAAHSFCRRKQLTDFFEKTFWAYQYGDFSQIAQHLDNVLVMLNEWGFITGVDSSFVSASLLGAGEYNATSLGKRIAELYLDPLTAHDMILGIQQTTKKNTTFFSLLHLICCTLEMRPLLNAGIRELDRIKEQLVLHDDELLKESDCYDYEEYLDITKTALLLHDWINESDEEMLYENYNIRPGELHAKLEKADWLLFALGELSRLAGFSLQKEISNLRLRLGYGAKEELLPLLRFEGIGKVRARILYTHGIRDVSGVKNAPFSMLAALVGKQVATSLKKQVGIPVTEEKASTLAAWSAE